MWAISLLARSLLVLTILFGLMFVVVALVGEILELPDYAILPLGLAVLAIHFFLSPISIDWTLQLLYRFDWVSPESVDPKMVEFLKDLFRAYRIPVPRFGVIADKHPCALKGKLIGSGEPGFILGADMVLKDETGFIVLLYRQPLPIFEWVFGLLMLEQLIGLTVTAIGCYRRAPMPYVELLKVVTEQGVEFKCYIYQTRLVLGSIAFAVGILFLVLALVVGIRV
ncbi:MAG: hypothetical protein N3B10_02025 [Armatimonadetes bacterium]|nr:hypothetical protein [Armatimonadota bacterium]